MMPERNNSEGSGMDSIIKISIVIPVFNEEQSVNQLYQKIVKAFENNQSDYEIIFIDDGSMDSTFEKLKEISRIDNHIKIVKFRKNFGKSIALNAAFNFVRGSVIITMDGDLQDDPEEIPRFLSKIDEGFDLVCGWKYPRFDPFTKTLPSKFFNKLTCLFTGVDLHDFNCGFKAYKRVVIKNIQLYGEMHRYIPALAAWNGFKITEIQIKHHPRYGGKTKYGFSRLIKGFLDLITVKFLTNYATRPLHVFGVSGLLSIFAGIVIGLYLLILKYLDNAQLGERPLLLLSILLIVIGFQFLSMGLLAEMIAFRDVRDQNIDRFIELVID
ncbi:MAG: glycosyltransferase family 2 protein [Methanomicrobiales archaeon]